MCQQRPLLEELLAADLTGMGHSTVHPAVIHELKLPLERSAAVLTSEGMQAAVEARMHREVFLLGKGLAALLANVGTLSRVKLGVRHQMSLQGESPAAFLAYKGPFSCVDSRMRHEVVFQGKRLFTLSALEGPFGAVEQQVGMEAVLVGEAFAAVGAHVRSLKKKFIYLFIHVTINKYNK